MQLARLNGIDAVITLSNQFTALPEHHPVQLPRALTKGLGVYHWSWMHVLTQAMLLLHDDELRRRPTSATSCARSCATSATTARASASSTA